MKLHLVAFSIPYPPDYGGVIDVFYKLKALRNSGVEVVLHCFEYGERTKQKELETICSHVYYYKRINPISSVVNGLPYFVGSRMNTLLLENLKQDNLPILFEGIHCSGYANHPDLTNRIKIIRTHNIESRYYENLSNASSAPFLKRQYWDFESKRLKKSELKLLESADFVMAISKSDQSFFSSHIDVPVKLVSAFHPYEKVVSKAGTGKYALFHGDLSVGENADAAIELMSMCEELEFPLYIAGKNPSEEFESKCMDFKNIHLEKNVTHSRMNDLIQDAQLILLHGFHKAGFKLKWLYSLFAGRHCLVPEIMLTGALAEEAMHSYKDWNELKDLFLKYSKEPFIKGEIEKRKSLLLQEFSNEKNAEKIIAEIIKIQDS